MGVNYPTAYCCCSINYTRWVLSKAYRARQKGHSKERGRGFAQQGGGWGLGGVRSFSSAQLFFRQRQKRCFVRIYGPPTTYFRKDLSLSLSLSHTHRFRECFCFSSLTSPFTCLFFPLPKSLDLFRTAAPFRRQTPRILPSTR